MLHRQMPYVVTPNYLQRRNDRKMSILPPIKIGHLYGLADDEDKVIFGGRLGMYQYFDMWKVIEEALKLVESLE